MKHKIIHVSLVINSILVPALFCQAVNPGHPVNRDEIVTIALLLKDNVYSMPLYLTCIQNQTWPKKQTRLYIPIVGQNADIRAIINEWAEAIKEDYLDIHFDYTDEQDGLNIQGRSEWDPALLKTYARVYQKSIEWAQAHKSHYFVVESTHLIVPGTLEALIEVNLPIVAPLLKTRSTYYSNFHACTDQNGYYQYCPLYDTLITQEIHSLAEVPVVNGTYLIRYNVLDDLSYIDDSNRHAYVVFSEIARQRGIPQYLDTRNIYGRIMSEPWVNYLKERPAISENSQALTFFEHFKIEPTLAFEKPEVGTTPFKIISLPGLPGSPFLVKETSLLQLINTVIATMLFKELLGDELVPDAAVMATGDLYANECAWANNGFPGIRKYYLASKIFQDVISNLQKLHDQNKVPTFCEVAYDGENWSPDVNVLNITEHGLYQGTEAGAIVSMILQDIDAFNNCGNHGYRPFGTAYKLVRLDLDHADLFFAPYRDNPLSKIQGQLTDTGKEFLAKLKNEKEQVLARLFARLDESFGLLRVLFTDEEIELIYKQCAGSFYSSEKDITPYYRVNVGEGPWVEGLGALRKQVEDNLKQIFDNI